MHRGNNVDHARMVAGRHSPRRLEGDKLTLTTEPERPSRPALAGTAPFQQRLIFGPSGGLFGRAERAAGVATLHRFELGVCLGQAGVKPGSVVVVPRGLVCAFAAFGLPGGGFEFGHEPGHPGLMRLRVARRRPLTHKLALDARLF